MKSASEHIKLIIQSAYSRVQKAYDKGNGSVADICTRLVFPKKTIGGQTRVSEQELRFSFVEAFNVYVKENCLDWYYAVEVPTQDKYNFKEKPIIDPQGQSAMFDLVIYDKDCRKIALIEFKAKNPRKHDYEKDFLKLTNPKEGGEDVLRYFLQIVESYDKNTINKIKEKIDGIGKVNNVRCICYSLSCNE